MLLAGRPQQQRRRVHGAARHDDERAPRRDASRRSARLRPPRPAGPKDPSAGVARTRRSTGVTVGRCSIGRMQQTSASLFAWTLHGNELHVLQSMQPSCSPGRSTPSGSGDGCSPRPRSCSTIAAMPGACATASYGYGPSRWLRRVDAMLSAHVVETLGPFVVRLERLVVDRPRRRDTVGVLDRLEIFAPQAIEHAAPELGVAPDTVVGVRLKLPAASIEPLLGDAVAQVLPYRLRAPVLLFLRNEATALEDEDAGGRGGQRVRDRPAAGAAADDDDVEAIVPHPEGAGPTTVPPPALRCAGTRRKSDP